MAEKAYGNENIQDKDREETRHHAQTMICMQIGGDAKQRHDSYINGDILYRLILGKTKSGEVIKIGTVSVGSVEPF